MPFGHFFYPMNFDASRDYEAIEECLLKAELVEQLGFKAIWIAEYHFIGEAVYGDPLGFAAAVAVKTQRVIIGLGIIEMALHHPVRLAIQTTFLDDLRRGWLACPGSTLVNARSLPKGRRNRSSQEERNSGKCRKAARGPGRV